MPELEQIEFEEHIYPCAYKVVTSDLKSLGLRRNPNINNYPIRKWYFLDPEEIQEGEEVGERYGYAELQVEQEN